jgi:hypothetical protein
MDMNKDAKLNYDEFKEGSKQDPTIVQVRPAAEQSRTKTNPLHSGTLALRRSRVNAYPEVLEKGVRDLWLHFTVFCMRIPVVCCDDNQNMKRQDVPDYRVRMGELDPLNCQGSRKSYSKR